jgi:hypothetical protein
VKRRKDEQGLIERAEYDGMTKWEGAKRREEDRVKNIFPLEGPFF